MKNGERKAQRKKGWMDEKKNTKEETDRKASE